LDANRIVTSLKPNKDLENFWIVYFGLFWKLQNYPLHIFGLPTFSTVKVCLLFFCKMFLATFWAIFSQTHLVTLNLIQMGFNSGPNLLSRRTQDFKCGRADSF
jgi:hypothetical protein